MNGSAGPGAQAFILGCNTNTLAFVSSTHAEVITAHLVPLAWTPIGVVAGNTWSTADIPVATLLQWIDQTFAAEDEHAFVAQIHDLDMLLRIHWNAHVPDVLDEDTVLNIEDVPAEIADALVHATGTIVQCAACRRLCVKDEFAWNERQLCAWDYHTSVFGKRGPWRNGAYEERLFDTLPDPAYVAPPLLEELKVELVLATGALENALARTIVNQVLDADAARAHLAVKTDGGYTILRERTG
ncbi:MAG: hypothetical protein NVS9B12_13220 [Vulcanimicrobiaceae bacterium]